jgi:hypothetical protein
MAAPEICVIGADLDPLDRIPSLAVIHRGAGCVYALHPEPKIPHSVLVIDLAKGQYTTG